MLVIPLGHDDPMPGRPWANWAIISATVGIFVAARVSPAFAGALALDCSSLHVPDFITYALVHAGWTHLLVNIAVLLVLGPPINRRLGQIGYLAFYFAAAVFAAAVYLLCGGTALRGASGAIGALIGAHLVLLPRANLHLFVVYRTIHVPAVYVLTIVVLYNLAMAAAEPLGERTVAYEAHLAGIGFGLICGLLAFMLRGRNVR